MKFEKQTNHFLNESKLKITFTDKIISSYGGFSYSLLKPRSENDCKEIALHMILQVSDVLWKKQPDRSFPRFSRKPRNRWCESKNKRA